MNFSRWEKYNAYDRADMLDKACHQVTNHTMPLWQYQLLHAPAHLSDRDTAAICGWAKDESARLVQEGG